MKSKFESYLRAAKSLFSILRTFPTKYLQLPYPSSNTDNDSISSETLQFLAAGKAGVVYGIDHERVLKEYIESDGGEVERRAYQRLGSHPNIAVLHGTRKEDSIILERGEVLRTICRSPFINGIPLQKKFHWLKNAAEGLKHSHNRDIIHADVGCNNMIITRKGDLKIIDFEGCSIDGEPADSCYEWFSYRPSSPSVSRRTDIFAFGCAIYEVITGRPPYHELEASDDRHQRIRELYIQNSFPDVADLPLGRLIQNCWHADFNSMGEIIQELEALGPILHSSGKGTENTV